MGFYRRMVATASSTPTGPARWRHLASRRPGMRRPASPRTPGASVGRSGSIRILAAPAHANSSAARAATKTRRRGARRRPPAAAGTSLATAVSPGSGCTAPTRRWRTSTLVGTPVLSPPPGAIDSARPAAGRDCVAVGRQVSFELHTWRAAALSRRELGSAVRRAFCAVLAMHEASVG